MAAFEVLKTIETCYDIYHTPAVLPLKNHEVAYRNCSLRQVSHTSRASHQSHFPFTCSVFLLSRTNSLITSFLPIQSLLINRHPSDTSYTYGGDWGQVTSLILASSQAMGNLRNLQQQLPEQVSANHYSLPSKSSCPAHLLSGPILFFLGS